MTNSNGLNWKHTVVHDFMLGWIVLMNSTKVSNCLLIPLRHAIISSTYFHQLMKLFMGDTCGYSSGKLNAIKVNNRPKKNNNGKFRVHRYKL